ncbi:G-type lectin S-receptor-like serine/threonine-protein kinase LECRK2 [Linum grandiflorum]
MFFPSPQFAAQHSTVATASSSSSPLSPILHPFILLLLLPLSAVAHNITVGDSLSAAENSPAPASSTARLTSAFGIILRDPQESQLWQSGQLTGGVDSASLTDVGNFTLDQGVSLSSRRSDSNFSKRKFWLVFQDDGNLVLTTVNLPTEPTNDPPYYASATDSGSSKNPGKQLVFDDQGFLYLSRENSSENLNLTGSLPPSSPNGGGFYHRVVLSFDGALTQYYYPKSGDGSSSWTYLWNQPDNICFDLRTDIGNGPCGFNSICNLELEGKPRCECPNGYR